MFEFNSEVKQGTTSKSMMIYTHVRIHAAGMHAGLFEHMHAVLGHQISRVYLTELSAQSDLIFSADLCMAIVPVSTA